MKMKFGKLIFGAAFLLLGVFASCDKDNEGALYQPTNSNVTLEKDNFGVITSTETSKDIAIRVYRAQTAGELTVGYTMITSAEGIFTDLDNGKVTFENGSGVAVINIKAENMVPGNKYDLKIELDDAAKATLDTITNHANYTADLSVFCEYVWEALDGKAVYNSPVAFENSWEVDVMRAKGTDIYKMVGLYEEAYDVIFSIDADNNVIVEEQPAWTYENGGTKYAVHVVGNANGDQSGNAGKYDPATKKVQLTLFHFIPKVGDFGTFADELTLP